MLAASIKAVGLYSFAAFAFAPAINKMLTIVAFPRFAQISKLTFRSASVLFISAARRASSAARFSASDFSFAARSAALCLATICAAMSSCKLLCIQPMHIQIIPLGHAGRENFVGLRPTATGGQQAALVMVFLYLLPTLNLGLPFGHAVNFLLCLLANEFKCSPESCRPPVRE